tara:strand:- start:518 stop:832 length:315 start_codon:yes stop_codon:yes gene_type:complete
MKFWKYIIGAFLVWCIASSYFAYDFVLNAQTKNFFNNSNYIVESKSNTETIKVDGVEYLVVETNNGVGVTLKLNKSNLRKLAEMVSEISDEMDAEKFNNIIQGK